MTIADRRRVQIFGALALLLISVRGVLSADAPDQIALGAQVYDVRCKPCHGDVGQGLALWRLTWAPEDQNCASRRCHGLGHPPDGFYMPKDAPPIIGKGTLLPYRTARDLYALISRRMPFDKPGELSSDDFWAVTAYLLHENGKLPADIWLDDSTASMVVVNPGLAQSPNTQSTPLSVDSLVLVVAAVVAALVGAILFALRRRPYQ